MNSISDDAAGAARDAHPWRILVASLLIAIALVTVATICLTVQA
jgi:hypothetical protein